MAELINTPSDRRKSEKLAELLLKAKDHVMTPEEIEAQRKSWVMGEMLLQYPTMTYIDAAVRYDEVVGTAKETDASPSSNSECTLQDRVHPWMMACFGPEIAADKLERGDRLLEEVFELLQATDYPRERIRALEEYVHGRPKGTINQEVGGVMITLAAHCLAHGVDMHVAGEIELARIWTKVDAIRAKQAAKPTGSALPIALAAASGQEGQ